jgi:hypothetical protein
MPLTASRYPLFGFVVALVLASTVTCALFLLMARLIRAPTATRRPTRSIKLVPAPRLHHATPPTTAKARPAPPPTLIRHPPKPTTVHRLPRPAIDSPSSVLHTNLAPAFSIESNLAKTPSLPAHIDWREDLNHYLRQRANSATPFKHPALPERPPAPQDMPLRMRLGPDLEIDRIGDTCYAVPLGRTSPVDYKHHLPAWMFAHKVPCLPGRHLAPGDDFLRHLHKRTRNRAF